MRPEISIIVPVYNVEIYLEKCLNSIIGQSFTNYEIILVNDGSTDNSGEICDEYCKKDERIRVINKDNGGLSSARNAGIKVAQGEFIGFVDSDDWIDKDMYKELYMLCTTRNSDISICKLGREINGKLVNDDEVCFIKEMNNIEGMRELFRGVLYRFSACNKLFKRSLFERIEFPEGRIHEDLATTYRLFAKANKAVYSNNIGYIYVKRENSILTTRFNEKRLDAFIGWDEILAFMKKRYPELTEEFISCYVYGCVDNVYYILNQVKDKGDTRKYMTYLQQYVKRYYKQIITSSSISLKYKYTITLLNYFIGLLLLSNIIKKIIRV